MTESEGNKSEQLHNEMLEIEQELFSELGLHYRYVCACASVPCALFIYILVFLCHVQSA